MAALIGSFFLASKLHCLPNLIEIILRMDDKGSGPPSCASGCEVAPLIWDERDSAEELFNAIQNGCFILDLRSPLEYLMSHAATSSSVGSDVDAASRAWETPDDLRKAFVYGSGAESSEQVAAAVKAIRHRFPFTSTCVSCSVPFMKFEARFPFLCVSDSTSGTSLLCYPQLIVPGVFLGSQLHASDRTVLSQLGITRVLNLAEETPNYFEAATDGVPSTIRYTKLPWTDSSVFPIAADLCVAADTIEEAVASGQPILVHCFQGMSRSGAAAAAWLIAFRNHSAHTAHTYLQEKRSMVRINSGFLQQLLDFEGEQVKRTAH